MTNTSETPGGQEIDPALAAALAENARLRDEIRQLESRTAAHGARGVLTGVLVALACLALVFSVLAVWLDVTLLTSSRFTATVDPIIRDPAVQRALSGRVSSELVQALDIRGRAQDGLPDRAKFLAAPLAVAVQEFVQRQLLALFSDSRFQDALLRALRFTHEQIVAILRGQSTLVTIDHGVVTLNLFPLINAGLRQIEATGLVPPGITLPNLSDTEAPSAARQQLSQALGRPLPNTFGELTLFESREVEEAQRTVRVLDALTVAIPIITAVLIVGAVAISPHRRRTILQLGIGAVIALLIMRLAVRLIGRAVEARAREDPTSASVVTAAVDSLQGSLLSFTNGLIVAGLLVAVVAFLVGRPSWFVAAWNRVKDLAGRGPSPATTRRWMDEHLDILRIAGAALAIAVLFIVPLSWATFLVVGLLLIAYQAALSLLHSWRSPASDRDLPAPGGSHP